MTINRVERCLATDLFGVYKVTILSLKETDFKYLVYANRWSDGNQYVGLESILLSDKVPKRIKEELIYHMDLFL